MLFPDLEKSFAVASAAAAVDIHLPSAADPAIKWCLGRAEETAKMV